MGALRQRPLAVLHQGHAPPSVGGIRKPPKPGGYADSSADIAFALHGAGVPVLTPSPAPDTRREMDWSFPDTEEGIGEAVTRGAEILWANTVLYAGHPIERVLREGLRIVGQPPENVGRFDDKRHTNERLRAAGIPVAAALVVGEYETLPSDVRNPRNLSERLLREQYGLELPLIVKPIRGRGSAGVVRVETIAALHEAMAALLAEPNTYGSAVMVEGYLSGNEVTVSVLPPGNYPASDTAAAHAHHDRHWALPPVLRFNHHDGVAPYNGVVAVTANSRALTPAEVGDDLRGLCAHCEIAAALVGARAAIRIDCRQDRHGRWKLFDLNMKPNMTGPGRPGRDDQDSLTAIAARAIGWDYTTLLLALLGQAWTFAG